MAQVGAGDPDILDKVLKLVQVPAIKNRNLNEVIDRVRKVILTPREVIKLDMHEMNCAGCGKPFQQGEVSTYTALHQQFFCWMCMYPELIPCHECGEPHEVLDRMGNLGKMVHKDYLKAMTRGDGPTAPQRPEDILHDPRTLARRPDDAERPPQPPPQPQTTTTITGRRIRPNEYTVRTTATPRRNPWDAPPPYEQVEVARPTGYQPQYIGTDPQPGPADDPMMVTQTWHTIAETQAQAPQTFAYDIETDNGPATIEVGRPIPVEEYEPDTDGDGGLELDDLIDELERTDED